MKTCRVCGQKFEAKFITGRPLLYCSKNCKDLNSFLSASERALRTARIQAERRDEFLDRLDGMRELVA